MMSWPLGDKPGPSWCPSQLHSASHGKSVVTRLLVVSSLELKPVLRNLLKLPSAEKIPKGYMGSVSLE